MGGALLSTPTTEPTFYTFGSPAPDFDEYALATEFLVWISEQLTTGDDTAASWFHYGSTEPPGNCTASSVQPLTTSSPVALTSSPTPSGLTFTVPSDTASNNSPPPLPARTGAPTAPLAPTPTPGSTRPGPETPSRGTCSPNTMRTMSAPCVHSA